MPAELHVTPSRATDADSRPYSGAKWYFYASGTSTPQAVYADADLQTSLGSTVTADSGGKFVPIYFDASLSYRGVCENSSGSTTLHDIDPINSTVLSELTGDAGSDMVGFKQAGTGAVARTVQDKLRDIIHLRDFGAVGDNTTDDTTAVANAINYCQSLTYTPTLYLGHGFYKVTSFPQLTKPITILGDDPRSSAFMFSGSTDAISVEGSGTRATAVQFKNLTLNGNAMTGGYLVNIDWAQDPLFENVIFNNPWNGVYGRQIGNLQFRNCLMSTVRGEVGVDLFSNNTTRNAENDQIDLVVFDSTIIQSDLPTSGGTNSVVMLRIDGRVHTVQFDGLRLLNGGIGLQTLNTPALASNLTPRFFVGSSLEVENMYAECLDLQAGREFAPAFLFAAGSHTADGVKLDADFAVFAPVRCSINSNYLGGLHTNGSPYVHLNKPQIYNNSLVAAGSKSGVYISGSGTVTIEGGLCGKDTSLPAYTELQKYGVEMDAAFTGTLLMNGVDVRANNTGTIYDNSLSAAGTAISGCPGYNPRGTGTQAASASPWTVVAGPTQESWMVAGTGISVTVGGEALPTSVMATTGGAFALPPRSSATITYSSVTACVVTKA